MIDADSRYSQSTIIPVVTGKRVRFVIIQGEQRNYTFNYQFYQVIDGDRIDNLAFRFYGDPLRWWVIADANPQRLDWGTLIPGEVIRIPMVVQQ